MERFRRSPDSHEVRVKKPRRLFRTAVLATGIAVTSGACELPKEHPVPPVVRINAGFSTHLVDITPERMGLEGLFSRTDTAFIQPDASVRTEIIIDDQQEEEFVPLMRIKKQEGKTVLIDTSPNGIDPEVIKFLNESLSDLYPVFDLAQSHDVLNQIVFAIQKDEDTHVGTQYFEETKDILFALRLNEGLNAEDMRATLMHEMGHAFFTISKHSKNNNKKPGFLLNKRIVDACRSIREMAAADITKNVHELNPVLDLYGNANPTARPIMDAMIDNLAKGKGNGLFKDDEDSKTPTCIFGDFVDFSNAAAELTGKEIDFIYDTQPGYLKTADDFEEKLSELLRLKTIYSAFTDSTYAPYKYAGHPWDNLDEAASSMYAFTELYPEEAGRYIARMAKSQRDAVIEFYSIVMDAFGNASPALARHLQPKIAQVKKLAKAA